MAVGLIYLLVALLALSAGICMGLASSSSHKRLLQVASFAVVVVVVVAGFHIGVDAVWIGPIFALVALLTSVMVAAYARREEPVFLANSYWRRMLLVMSGQ